MTNIKKISKNNYTKKLKDNVKGVSLIVLIITIIVIIILATAVILSIVSNNPIERSNEASFKGSLKSYETQLSLYIAEQLLQDNSYDSKTLNVNTNRGKHIKYGLEETLGGIQSIITSMKDDHALILSIVEGKLTIENSSATAQQIEWAKEAGIGAGEKPKISTYSKEKGVNKPLLAGMEPVRWDVVGTTITEDNTVLETSANWYDYVAGDNSTDSRDSMWANAKTIDGSYWVWIPRYAYRISEKPAYAEPQPGSGKIEVVFLIDDTDEYLVDGTKYTAKKADDATITASDYIVHPAFTFGEDKLTGIWVAKYEASHADAATAQVGSTAPAAGTSSNIKIVPNVTSWVSISVSEIFDKCYTMRSNSIYGWEDMSTVDTHMMKNIEWGAVAYLAHSQYRKK